MQFLNRAQLETMVRAKVLAVILFDAAWDNHRDLIRSKMSDADEAFGDRALFGEVDCDAEPELSREVGVLNVPTVIYFRQGAVVEKVIGAGQDVRRLFGSLVAGSSTG
jgi:thioredoxin 1